MSIRYSGKLIFVYSIQSNIGMGQFSNIPNTLIFVKLSSVIAGLVTSSSQDLRKEAALLRALPRRRHHGKQDGSGAGAQVGKETTP